MSKIKIIAVLAMIFALAGCASTPKEINFDENYSHPELPNPVQPYQFDFNVITKDNMNEKIKEDSVFLSIDYNDSLLFRQFLEDMKRYILEANGVICYYRQDLKESFCKSQEDYINRNDKPDEKSDDK